MRLIDADAFIEKNKDIIDCEIDHPKYQDTLRDLIYDAPTVERPHGEWITTHNIWADDVLNAWGHYKECSCCHNQEQLRTPFCSNCGADMRTKKTCGNCYWFSKVTVPCCEQDKEPTTENEKACDRWEEGESE